MPKYRRKKRQQAPYERSETQEETGEENCTCSECKKSVDQVLQCESCWNWFCGPCQNLAEEILQVAHFKLLISSAYTGSVQGANLPCLSWLTKVSQLVLVNGVVKLLKR